jgi:N6-L-threonylcarbamoyladenine synthase
VTYAPGLIGALLVGVNFAKAAALALDIPLVPVHHIRGHIAASYIAFPALEPPFVCLSISGGNTLILDVRDYTDTRVLGSTRDDAAGECFDKIARVLGMPYPGGKALDELAKTGNPDTYPLPRTKVSGYDMSFSGLKTATLNLIHNAQQKGVELNRPDLCAGFIQAVKEMLVPRTMEALEECGYGKLVVAGGVAANSHIRAEFQAQCNKVGAELYLPPLNLCGDNGAMIACQGYYEYLAGNVAGQDLNAVASRSPERGSINDPKNS